MVPSALPPAPSSRRIRARSVVKQKLRKKSRDGTPSPSPAAEPVPTPSLPPDVPAGPPCPPRPGPLRPRRRRGLNPSRDPRSPAAGELRPPGRQRWGRPRASGPCAGLRSQSSPRRPRRAGGGGSPYLSGLFPGPAAAQLQEPMSVGGPGPSPGRGGADPGERAGRPSSSSPFPCSPPGAWPGPDSASARPCAPSHTRAHTHSHSLARSHTHSPPSACSVYLLQLSGDPGEARHRACAAQSPPRPAPRSRPLRYGESARPFPEWRAGLPPQLAPGQRLRPAAPTNLLVEEPRTVATNPLCRSPDRQPVGGRESRTKPRSILGVVVFPLS